MLTIKRYGNFDNIVDRNKQFSDNNIDRNKQFFDKNIDQNKQFNYKH